MWKGPSNLHGDDDTRALASSFRGTTTHQNSQRPNVLIVDDDRTMCETVGLALRLEGCDVVTAQTGAEGLTIATTSPVDVVFLDLRLQDMDGLEVLRSVRSARFSAAVILMSGFLTVEIAVRAMHLGARDVLEKPIAIEQFVAAVERCARTSAPPVTRTPAAAEFRRKPGAHGSVSERWALLVMQALDATHDLKTLAQWARQSGVSYTTLCETCRMVGLRPQAARDFARLLRAVVRARTYGCSPSLLLDVGDQRTMTSLLHKGAFDDDRAVTPMGFIRTQRLIAQENRALQMLGILMQGGGFADHDDS